ncbi:hypothetical protein DPMN_021940 [Dreissena polymorpha]|uniref:Uncharacterized protein n=1 Tax=Dreissena polymorpha TaxID=45954 RepID=A0A9D4NNJ5_DREPO|nr:hypothetical protein DPMN_021940 [Dreissena polymorpha]
MSTKASESAETVTSSTTVTFLSLLPSCTNGISLPLKLITFLLRKISACSPLPPASTSNPNST